MSHKKEVYIPGEVVNGLQCNKNVLILGPGLKKNDHKSAVATLWGKIVHKPPNVYWMNMCPKRYVPQKNDCVVGIIVFKRGDLLRVDIQGPERANLYLTSFEGATKRQKPDVQIGDVVYARILTANRDMEPELVCVDSYYKAGRLGVLSNTGFLFSVELSFIYKLLNFDCPLLKTLGSKYRFEIAVGMNGRIWINAKKIEDMDTIYSTLRAAESLTDDEIVQFSKNL